MSEVYAPPQSNIELTAEDNGNNIHEFKRFSCWGYFGLCIVTLGVYAIYWLHSRTKTLNKVSSKNPISQGFTSTAIILYVINFVGGTALGITAGITKNETLLQIADVGNIISNIINVLFIVWAFKFRNRFNDSFGFNKGHKNFAGGILTFFLQGLYMQYKINQAIDADRARGDNSHTAA